MTISAAETLSRKERATFAHSTSRQVIFERRLFKYRHILIVTPTRANKAEINNRLMAARIPNLSRYVHVSTVDSALLNILHKGREYSAIIFDEGPMVHPGCFFLLLYITRANIAYILGDRKQIEFVNRVSNMVLRFSDWSLFEEHHGHNTDFRFEKISRRVRPDVARAFRFLYYYGFESSRDDVPSLFLQQMSGSPDFPAIPSEYTLQQDCAAVPKFHILTFTQFEKYFIMVRIRIILIYNTLLYLLLVFILSNVSVFVGLIISLRFI